MLQPRGRRDPPGDLSPLHPVAVLPGDVHNGDAQIHVPAGGAAAAQKKYHHKKQITISVCHKMSRRGTYKGDKNPRYF